MGSASAAQGACSSANGTACEHRRSPVPFVNVAVRVPRPSAHPVRQTVAGYRGWLRGVFRDVLAEAGAADPDGTALVIDDPAEVRRVVRDAVTRELAVRSARG
jgi:hypothetical protein